MNLLNDLNPYQKEAVLSNEGPVLVLAGAGSGKTRVITYKIAYLLKQMDVKPRQILAVTFTNKAAGEMKERVTSFIGKVKGLTVCTFHAFGVRFLREEITHLGYDKKFSIYSDGDIQGVIKNIIIELGLDEAKYPISLVSYLISQAKNNLQDPENATLDDAALRDIYRLYTKRLKTLNAVDFDDLIYLPVLLLLNNEELRNKWSKKYKFVLVDEYQDTNHLQYQLMKLLSSTHKNICVVGDDDQSIYAFRGAKVENILRFEKDFENAKTILLAVNYRNTPVILDAASSLIMNNKSRHHKKVNSFLKTGDKINLIDAFDANEEAELIASEVFENRVANKIQYKDQAVLCRTNTQMRTFEEVFRKKNIPYKLIGGYSFFDRKEVKDVLAYLKLIYNPTDNLAFLRTVNFPKRGIGDKTIEVIKNFAGQKKISLFESLVFLDQMDEISKPVAHKLDLFKELIENFEARFMNPGVLSTLKEIIDEVDFIKEYERIYKEESPFRVKSIVFLLEMAENFEKKKRSNGEYASLEGFLSDLCLFNKDDQNEPEEENKIPVMTIHASKGLEFDVIYLVGFEEGFIPHDRSIEEGNAGIEEERRLTYVAMTRARKNLVISYSCNRRIFGQEVERVPSRFLEEIPVHLIDSTYTNMGQSDDKSQEEIDLDFLKKLKDIVS